MFELKKGTTRYVILTKRYAIKIPSLHSYKHFMLGVIANLTEGEWWDWTKDDRLCPVLFRVWGGFLLVMPRVKLIEYNEMPDKSYFINPQSGIDFSWDYTVANIGILNGKYVKIDYGQ